MLPIVYYYFISILLPVLNFSHIYIIFILYLLYILNWHGLVVISCNSHSDEVMRWSRLRWMGHVLRKDKNHWVRRSMEMVIEGKRYGKTKNDMG